MNEKDLRHIADSLNSLEIHKEATLHYELMSDALVWSDEIPRHRRARELWCLRPIWRYRTGLILGLELDEFRPDWEAGKRLFPHWIGFCEDRSSRNIELEKEYHRLSKK
jgi:hypothetical protein